MAGVNQEQSSTHAETMELRSPGFENPGYLVLIVTLVGLALLWRREDRRDDRAMILFWAVVVAVGCVLSLGP